jgi:hypothetical protein
MFGPPKRAALPLPNPCAAPSLSQPLQTWVHPLWPYPREQDGVFVQLQALTPADHAAKPGSSSGKASKGASSKGSKGGGKQKKDATKAATDQGKEAGAGEDRRPEGSSPAPANQSQLSRVWFLRLGEKAVDGAFKVRVPQELPLELALLPTLLR